MQEGHAGGHGQRIDQQQGDESAEELAGFVHRHGVVAREPAAHGAPGRQAGDHCRHDDMGQHRHQVLGLGVQLPHILELGQADQQVALDGGGVNQAQDHRGKRQAPGERSGGSDGIGHRQDAKC
ncbi:hypothetical protein D3C72_1871350 [compost metagenome]